MFLRPQSLMCIGFISGRRLLYPCNQGIRKVSINHVRKHHCLSDVLSHWQQKFELESIPEAQASAELIIAHVKGLKTLHNVDTRNTTLNQDEVAIMDQLCMHRLKRMPVQYIIEEWDFCDLMLKMKPPVLIPRPETEELVDHCSRSMEECLMQGKRRPIFLEIGCGSGAISIALLHKFRNLKAISLDVSPEACQLTKENAFGVNVMDRLEVIEGDITKESVISQLRSFGPFSLLVSNPPYIDKNDIHLLPPEISLYEDHVALCGGESGLDLVNVILKNASKLVAPNCDIWLEVGDTQPKIIQIFAESDTYPSLTFMKSVKDMYERERFVHLQVSD